MFHNHLFHKGLINFKRQPTLTSSNLTKINRHDNTWVFLPRSPFPRGVSAWDFASEFGAGSFQETCCSHPVNRTQVSSTNGYACDKSADKGRSSMRHTYCSDFKLSLYVVTYYKVTSLYHVFFFLSSIIYKRENSRKPCPIWHKHALPCWSCSCFCHSSIRQHCSRTSCSPGFRPSRSPCPCPPSWGYFPHSRTCHPEMVSTTSQNSFILYHGSVKVEVPSDVRKVTIFA